MQNVRFKGLLPRSKFIILFACCTIISPQLCQETDYEILDGADNLDSRIEMTVDRTQRTERELDYPTIYSNQFEKANITCVEHFCENVSNYPLEEINNAVKNIPSSVFQNIIEITNRLSPEEGESLCDTTHRTIYPERANNTNNKEVFIVNIEEKKQGIIIRKCREGKNGRCGKATFPEGYIGECTQRYSQVRLLAFNNKGGEDGAVFDTFSVPSCCVCSLKKTSG